MEPEAEPATIGRNTMSGELLNLRPEQAAADILATGPDDVRRAAATTVAEIKTLL